jgi:hypothetical protein
MLSCAQLIRVDSDSFYTTGRSNKKSDLSEVSYSSWGDFWMVGEGIFCLGCAVGEAELDEIIVMC